MKYHVAVMYQSTKREGIKTFQIECPKIETMEDLGLIHDAAKHATENSVKDTVLTFGLISWQELPVT